MATRGIVRKTGSTSTGSFISDICQGEILVKISVIPYVNLNKSISKKLFLTKDIKRGKSIFPV